MKEMMNPVDLPYKYSHYGLYAHREAADPTMVYFKGRYYCFASMSAGFFWSDDLCKWRWHEAKGIDIYRYAPDVRVIGEWLYFTASSWSEPSIIRRTKDPMTGVFEEVSAPFAFWDPALFADDDGKVYLYWGCSNENPIYGIEMNPETMRPIGEKRPLIGQDYMKRGWERFGCKGVPIDGEPEGTCKKPYIEGAYLTKINGKYYLQYAAPATEIATYGDGVFISDKPLGPYTFCPNSPFSFKPAGFITGAGHGSTIADEYGNLWHSSTGRISVNQSFERRVVISPAGVDNDGIMYCNQQFADYPIQVPEGKFDAAALRPSHMLLSYKKSATCSSSLPDHGPELALNEECRTWWVANGSSGEWISVDLGKVYPVHSIQLNFADHEIPRISCVERDFDPTMQTCRYIDTDPSLHTRYTLEASADGKNWFMLDDASTREEDRSHPYLILARDTAIRYIRLTCIEMPYHAKCAVSGIRVFGVDPGVASPKAVCEASSVREEEGLSSIITWKSAEGAMGYHVCFGIAPNKLYHSYIVYGENNLRITALNAGIPYWYRIDSFNEHGITNGEIFRMDDGNDR